MSRSVRAEVVVAAAQLAGTDDVATNLAGIKRLTIAAAHRGASVVVFPEAVMYDFTVDGAQLARAANRYAAEFEKGVQQIAHDSDVHIVAGVYGMTPSGKASNTLIVADPNGKTCARYDKLHLYDAFSFQESAKHDPAPHRPNFDELTVFEAAGLRFGLVNCYDLRFPEMARLLLDRGADALLVASGWVAGPLKSLQWETLLRARAIENTCYVVGSCQPAPNSVGRSMIIDPMGAQIAGLGETEGIAVGTLSMERQLQVRVVLPCLSQRRYSVVQGEPSVSPRPVDCHAPIKATS